MTELVITELENRVMTKEQGCQTMPTSNKSTEIDESIFRVLESKSERKKNYYENRMLRHYYKNRNQKTDILNTILDVESQREKEKKEIIDKLKTNNKTPNWVVNMKT